MSQVNLSLSIADTQRAPSRRLPRALGWSLAGLATTALWLGAIEIIRVLF